ncbi:MAG: hypothetical protein PVI40_09305 [Chlamydiota bacterium]|jgi:hypothetical protein
MTTPNSFPLSTLAESYPFLFINSLSYLKPEEQATMQRTCRAWCEASQSPAGLFAFITSAVGLKERAVTRICEKGYFPPIITHKFHEQLDPSGKTLGKFLSEALSIIYMEDPQKMLSFLENLPTQVRETIQCLNLKNAPITDEHIVLILQFCPKLSELDLSVDIRNKFTTFITGEGLAAISKNNALKMLSLSGCKKLNEQALQIFFSKANFLEDLKLSSTNITGVSLKTFSAAHLKKLDLGRCYNLEEAGLEGFLEKAESLEELDLSRTNVTGSALIALNLLSLKKLNLDFCNNLNPQILKKIFSSSTLEELKVVNNSITSDALLSLSTEKLKKIEVRLRNHFPKEDIKAFFQKATNLEDIHLYGMAVTGEELLSLNLSKLKKLCLGLCPKLNEKVLFQVFQLAQELKTIGFFDSNITGEGLLALNLSKLKRVYLSFCHNLKKEFINQLPREILIFKSFEF